MSAAVTVWLGDTICMVIHDREAQEHTVMPLTQPWM
jgi:hypothetical protein